MTDELTRAAVATYAARHLPVRLDLAGTAKLLGFAEYYLSIDRFVDV
jgi:hypothetical protein